MVWHCCPNGVPSACPRRGQHLLDVNEQLFQLYLQFPGGDVPGPHQPEAKKRRRLLDVKEALSAGSAPTQGNVMPLIPGRPLARDEGEEDREAQDAARTSLKNLAPEQEGEGEREQDAGVPGLRRVLQPAVIEALARARPCSALELLRMPRILGFSKAEKNLHGAAILHALQQV